MARRVVPRDLRSAPFRECHITQIREWLAGLSPAVRGALFALVAVQVAVQIAAVVHLVRRSRAPRSGRAVWAVVIVAGNLLGAVLYFALARGPDAAAETTAGDAQAARRATDVLYGPRDRS